MYIKREQEAIFGTPTGKTSVQVLFLYHLAEKELWFELQPHINVLLASLNESDRNESITLKAEYYFISDTDEEPVPDLAPFIHSIENATIFFPCTSAKLLNDLLIISRDNPQLHESLNSPYTVVIPFKAFHNISSPIYKPLATYSQYDRAEGAVHITEIVEKKLMQYIPQSEIPSKSNKFLFRSLIAR